MFRIFRNIPKRQILCALEISKYQNIRTFLSEAYYCHDVWDNRLKNPILQKVVTDDLYHELDQRYQRTKQLSALDIDIFANTLSDVSFADELLDLVHKLRLTADTGNTLNSTCHAVVRTLLKFERVEDLLNALDDRLNYGLFIDYYTANILMDTFWKLKQFANGTRIASLLMLQEELDHPLSCSLSVLHCINYLLQPQGWPEPVISEEPEEEVKVRVKYLRNPYDDEHFDLKNPNQIIGKTLIMISKNRNDTLHQSLYVLGLALFGKNEVLQTFCSTLNNSLYKEILDLVPGTDELKSIISKINTDSVNVQELLIENVKKAYHQTSEKDISQQCELYEKWEAERGQVFEDQNRRLSTARRLQDIDDLKKAMKAKEEKLWFFDNEESIDMEISRKKVFYPKRWFGAKKKPRKIDEGYVPPEIQTKQMGGSQLS